MKPGSGQSLCTLIVVALPMGRNCSARQPLSERSIEKSWALPGSRPGTRACRPLLKILMPAKPGIGFRERLAKVMSRLTMPLMSETANNSNAEFHLISPAGTFHSLKLAGAKEPVRFTLLP